MTRITNTLNEELWKFILILLRVLRMGIVLDKSAEEIKTHLNFNNFFPQKIMPFCDNVGKKICSNSSRAFTFYVSSLNRIFKIISGVLISP
jgi:hypothetical protein